MGQNYEMEFTVKHFECDAWLNMSVGALLRRVQTISTLHADELGLTADVYAKTNTVFLLSRMSVKINKLPTAYNKVRLVTRAFEAVRATYSRITALYDEGGELLCEVDSRWVLVDIVARRILRKAPQEFALKFTQSAPDVQHDMLLAKPEELCQPIPFKAVYSLCDYNRHINNTKYADLVCDVLPLELFEKGQISRMLLFYRVEIGMGEEFTMQYGKTGENAYYAVLQKDGRKNLEAFVEF